MALITSLLLVLAFAYEFVWLAPIALLPFALGLRREEPTWLLVSSGLLLQGYLHSFAWNYSLCGWFLLSALKALPFVLFHWVKGQRFSPLRFATLWAMIEWFNGLGPFGHNVGSLPQLLVNHPSLLQSLSYTGPWLVTLLLAAFSSYLSKLDRRGLILCSIVSVALAGWGAVRCHQVEPESGFRVALVQSCLDSRLKFRNPRPKKEAERLLEMTIEASQDASLVVWPETAFPWTDLRWDAEWAPRVGGTTRDFSFHLLAASLEEGDAGWRNTVHLVGPTGQFLDTYEKRRLVPMVETLPWESMRKWSLFEHTFEIEAGQKPGILEIEGVQVGLLICWESMNSFYAKELTQKGAQMLVITTNDQWFDGTPVARFHFQVAILRALETGRPVVQVANNGISGFIDHKGQVQKLTQLDERVILTGLVHPTSRSTLYLIFGDLPFIVLLIILNLALARSQTKTEKPESVNLF